MNLEATSILTLGASGVLDGVPFTLVGRRCIRGNRGAVWNEWTLEGLPHTTLAESAGRFTLYREAPLIASVEKLVAGARLPWVVVERGMASSAAEWGSVAPVPESWEYADLSEVPSGRRATMTDGTAFIGQAVDPVALGLTIRREPPALVPTPNVAMPSGLQLWLEVGDKGTLEGTEWHVVGIVARKTETAQWEEYCVYSAGIGLRWLVVSDGHWLYVSPVEPGTVEEPFPLAALAASARGDAEPPAPDVPRVIWAAGELPWAVAIGETVMAVEVGDLAGEYAASDITWSRQQPLATDDVARAFNKRAMPKPR